MERIAREIGMGLRRARRARGLTLREVTALSEGRFKPTSVAGYERGERAISLERFIDLCRIYAVPPHALLAEIVVAEQGTPEPPIDLTVLEQTGPEEEALVAGFIRQIRALRREHPTGAISLRAGDLEVLASGASDRLEEAIESEEVLEPSDSGSESAT